MTTTIFTIISNERIAKSVYKMVLSGNASEITRAGQFVNIKLDGFYLRRPISVCDFTDDMLTIIYKTVGKGTEYMATLKSGQTLDILLPLGNGYNLDNSAVRPLILGGGVGVPPMYHLAKRLIGSGAE
ncbi:MAG: dihydroorotate dehydrogenase electron transfer subunit, partial [Acutalibacteraceae bacterium]|nr:dihydroorotate dehydrogenase electron transfer subunit [Acutalibacteraceae bacterium]